MSDVIPSTGGVSSDGSPEGHVEKMLAMGDGSGDAVEPTGDAPAGDQVATRPDNVPEKFWDAEKGQVNTEALLKSQADAEAALRAKDGDANTNEGDANEGEGDKTPASEAAQGKVVADASAEYAEKGELTAETFTALESVGLSKEMVETYIAGQTAIVTNLQNAAYTPFEGKDGYEAAANKAAEVMSEDEIKALDVQLTSNNPAIVAQGAKALASWYSDNADIEPSTIRGDGNTSTVGGVYSSSRDMMKDMNSHKYKTSESFRQEVAAKLGRSNL